ncbi:MAG: MFS transporter [Armatimonadetes bacterium]|nr:MFS transporter [Armatimonadota bacterium]
MQTSGAEATPVWRRPPIFRLLLIALAAELGFAVLNVSVMPVYLKLDRGFSGTVFTTVLAAFLFSEAVFKPFAGHLADKHGRRMFLILAPALVVLTPLLSLAVPYGWGHAEVVSFVGLRVIDGLAAAMLWPAIYAAVGEAVGPEERTQGMSLLNVCFMLGLALGPLVGGVVNDLFGSRVPSFVLASALFLATGLAAFRFAAKDSRKDRIAEGRGLDEHRLQDLIQCARKIPLVLALAFVVFLAVGLLLGVIKPLASELYSLSETQFGLILLPAAVSMAILGVPISKWGERLGGRRAVQLGLLLCATGIWLVAIGAWFDFARNLAFVAFSGALVGVGFLMAIPSWQAAIGHIDPRRAGSYLGAVMTAQGVGAIVGVPIGGLLFDIGHFWPIIGCASTLSACVLLAAIAIPKP